MNANIKQFINLMLKFQKENNITKQCVSNTQVLYDYLCFTKLADGKAQAVICVDLPTFRIVYHMVYKTTEGDIYESSYEWSEVDDLMYFDNIPEFMAMFSKIVPVAVLKEVIKAFLRFTLLADKINNDKFASDLKYYTNQLEYVSAKFKNMGDFKIVRI